MQTNLASQWAYCFQFAGSGARLGLQVHVKCDRSHRTPTLKYSLVGQFSLEGRCAPRCPDPRAPKSCASMARTVHTQGSPKGGLHKCREVEFLSESKNPVSARHQNQIQEQFWAHVGEWRLNVSTQVRKDTQDALTAIPTSKQHDLLQRRAWQESKQG